MVDTVGTSLPAPPQPAAIAIAPGRSCGLCTMCCKVPYIAEFDKPPGVWCAHARPGRGCADYEHRPQSCRDFLCEWIVNDKFGPEWKPDTAKFVVHPIVDRGNLLIAVDPKLSSAWRREPYHTTIRGWAKTLEPAGRFVIVRTGRRCLILLPDGERELGDVGVDDEIIVERSHGPAGFVYGVEVQRTSVKL